MFYLISLRLLIIFIIRTYGAGIHVFFCPWLHTLKDRPVPQFTKSARDRSKTLSRCFTCSLQQCFANLTDHKNHLGCLEDG